MADGTERDEGRTVRFRVVGHLPPKKDGANSMWCKSIEVERLIQLRHAAFEATGGRPFDGARLRLRIDMRCPNPTARSTGDLDNFITGICDGLQRAHSGTPWRGVDEWCAAENARVAPDRFEAFPDDARFVEIVARKEQASAPEYVVEIAEEVEP